MSYADLSQGWAMAALTLAIVLTLLMWAGWKLLGPRYGRQGQLLTASERSFLRALQGAAADRYWIATKVRIADVLSVQGSHRESRRFWRAFTRISSKHVDFVLCDPESFRIMAAIEVDDRSHQRPDRRARDQFVNRAFRQAGLPLIRVPAARRYCTSGLRDTIAGAIEKRS